MNADVIRCSRCGLQRALVGFAVLAACGAPTLAGTAKPAAHSAPPPVARRSRFRNGLPGVRSYFPIAVWLQDPKNAPRFQAAGINLYVGLWQGPTDAQLAELKKAGMRVICEQNAVGLRHRNDPTIAGWMHQDEPDNAQPVTDPTTGKQGWGGPVPPPRMVAEYDRMRQLDPTRPVMINLGQGVANDRWIGRGTGSRPDDYLTYVKAADIVSFDVYPIAGLDEPHPENDLWYVARGVSRLMTWTAGKESVWNCLECTHIGDPARQATPHEVRAEAWMSIIHGSRGLIWFVHQFKPVFDEHALLDDPTMLVAVTALNHQIEALAPVVNAPETTGLASEEQDTGAPVDIMARRADGADYLFAVGMRNAPAMASFRLSGLPRRATAEVLGENRSIPVVNGRFKDSFSPYDVHLYRVRR